MHRPQKNKAILEQNRLDDSLSLDFVSFLLSARILIPTSEMAMKQ